MIILFSLVLLGKINAQLNCEASVPNQVLNMNNSPFEFETDSFSMLNTGTGYLCCSAGNSFGCKTFSINTHVNTIGIIFESYDYNDTVNIQYANCNTIYPLGITENTEANEYQIKQNYDTKKIQITSLKDDILSVKIYTIEGKVLIDQENIMENNIVIDLQLINSGVFVLKIENKKRSTKSYKFINL